MGSSSFVSHDFGYRHGHSSPFRSLGSSGSLAVGLVFLTCVSKMLLARLDSADGLRWLVNRPSAPIDTVLPSKDTGFEICSPGTSRHRGAI